MKICPDCGREIAEDAVFCPYCGKAQAGGAPIPITVNPADQISVGLCILAAFFPLFGIIYWALYAKERPRRAKAIGITALVSWAVNFLFAMIQLMSGGFPVL